MPVAFTQPAFQVVVTDPVTGLTSAVFDSVTFFDLRYSRILNDVGVITITLPYTPETASAFKLDSIIQVMRTSPVTGLLAVEDYYFARYFNVYRQTNIENLVIGGLHLNHLVARRVVNPFDDPSAAGGYSTQAGPADMVLWHYANYNLGPGASIARQCPGLSIPVPLGVGLGVGYRLRFDDLYKTFQDATARGGVDFNIQRTTGAAMELDIATIGTDRRQSTHYPWGPFVLLNPQRGNLSDPNLLQDRKAEKNVVYALGQGQDVNREFLISAADSALDSPFNYIEYTDTSTNVQKGDATGLLTAARASLKKNGYAPSFTFKGLGTEPGNLYQQDYFLGDLISVSYAG